VITALIDHQLIYAARLFINGANVHEVSEMIYLYELAVTLFNKASGRQKYRISHELRLRRFVRDEQIALFLRRSAA
jgi:hypothetical protein